MRHVQVHAPNEILLADDVTTELNLNTTVSHITNVGPDRRVTGLGRYAQAEEHVRSLAVEDVDTTIEAITPETKLNTYVQVRVGLPRNILVTLANKHVGYTVVTVVLDRIYIGIEVVVRQTVVTLRTERSLELQHVNPVSVEPSLLVDNPSGTNRPEVTPAVVGVEHRRSIATERSREVVTILVIVHTTEHVTLVVVLRNRRRAGRAVRNGTRKLRVVGREHTTLRCAQTVALTVVHLMTNQQVYVVVAKRLNVGQELLEVVRNRTAVALTNDTTVGSKLTIVTILYRGRTRLINRYVTVYGQLQTIIDVDIGETTGREGVTLRAVHIELHRLQRVRRTGLTTYHTGVATITKVIYLEAVLVDHDITLTITNIERIDGSGQHSIGEGVTTIRSTLIVGAVTIVPEEVRVREVTTNLQPLLGLIVSAQTSRQTLHVRTVNDTRVVQVTHRSVEVGAIRSSSNIYVVLLAERCILVDLIEPVVGLHPILLTIVGHLATLRSLGVDLTVRTDQVLTLGVRHHVVAQTTLVVREHVARSPSISLSLRLAQSQRLVVHHGSVIHLIVLASRVRYVIRLQGLRVDTPLAIERHNSVTNLSLLGRDHDHTVCTTSTIEGVRSCILQDRHRLDIGRVQVVDVTLIGHTVHYIQGRGTGIHRTNTANGQRLTGTETTRSRRKLHTGYLTNEGVRYVRRLRLGDVVRLNHLCRTGEGLFLGRTEGNHDYIVDRLRVLVQRNCNVRLTGNLNGLRLITNERDLQRTIGRSRNGKATIGVGRRTVLGTYNDYRSTGNRLTITALNCT